MKDKAPDIRILTIRDQKVVLDSDLARVYSVTTKRLNEQLRRNRKRFPEDFAFQLTAEEFAALTSQIATLDEGTPRGESADVRLTGHGPLPNTAHSRPPTSCEAIAPLR